MEALLFVFFITCSFLKEVIIIGQIATGEMEDLTL